MLIIVNSEIFYHIFILKPFCKFKFTIFKFHIFLFLKTFSFIFIRILF